jgi:ArsR family transcriptional regulator, arsenate/arsenite/antimonite-responsive transcriptional repressor
MDTKKIERISKALADETRLRIFEAISAQRDLTCGELVTLRGVTPATISHHLKILMDSELIECRKDGQFFAQPGGAGDDCGIFGGTGEDGRTRETSPRSEVTFPPSLMLVPGITSSICQTRRRCG